MPKKVYDYPVFLSENDNDFVTLIMNHRNFL